MKTAFSIVLGLFFSVTLYAQIPKVPGTVNSKSNDKAFFNEDSRFTINYFGEKPTKTETPVETAVGTIDMTTYMYEKTLSEVYMVAISAFPEKHIAASDTKTLLEGSKTGFCSNLSINLTKSEIVYIKGNEGIYFEASNNSGYYSAVVDYLVGNVLYQIAILRTDRAPTQKEIDEFIFSFSLK